MLSLTRWGSSGPPQKWAVCRRPRSGRSCSIPPPRKRRENAPTASSPSSTVATSARQRASRVPETPVVAQVSPSQDLTWRRIDLHIHTPASVDYQQPGVGILDVLHRAEERGLDAIALTDHNSVRGYAELWREIEDLELLEYLGRLQPNEAERLAESPRLLAQTLRLPGSESPAQFGFHILAIFPEGTTVRLLSTSSCC